MEVGRSAWTGRIRHMIRLTRVCAQGYVARGVPRGQPKAVPQGEAGGNFLGASSCLGLGAPERRLAVVIVRDRWVVHPGDLVVGFGQRVESDHYDHRGGAHGPGGVTGAGASPTLLRPGSRVGRRFWGRSLPRAWRCGGRRLDLAGLRSRRTVGRRGSLMPTSGNLPATWSWWMAQWLGRGCATPNSSPVVSATRVPRISSSVAEVCSGRCARRTASSRARAPTFVARCSVQARSVFSQRTKGMLHTETV